MKIIGIGPRRSFRLTVGTKPGYAPLGVAKTVNEVRDLIHEWLASRATEKKFILPGVLTAGQVVYVYPSDAGVVRAAEPVCVYAGEVSTLYCADVADGDVTAALNELAAFLAEQLDQTRVYVAYGADTWVVEREAGEPSPRGESKSC